MFTNKKMSYGTVSGAWEREVTIEIIIVSKNVVAVRRQGSALSLQQ